LLEAKEEESVLKTSALQTAGLEPEACTEG